MASIGLRPGDSIRYGDMTLVVISGVTTLSASFADGSKAWCEEILAGEYIISKGKHLTKGQPNPKLTGD